MKSGCHRSSKRAPMVAAGRRVSVTVTVILVGAAIPGAHALRNIAHGIPNNAQMRAIGGVYGVAGSQLASICR